MKAKAAMEGVEGIAASSLKNDKREGPAFAGLPLLR